MATKNLARTVIEGGRAFYNHWERDYSHRRERARFEQHRARLSAGYDADGIAVEERPRVRKSFHDKLGPAERWLRSQVGKPFDKVRSLATRTFDARTLPGRHILYDHLLPARRAWGTSRPEDAFGPARRIFFVDARGVLRERVGPSRRHGRTSEKQVFTDGEIELWTASRRIGRRGNMLFWFVIANAPRFWPTNKRFIARYRQGARLDDVEARKFEQLTTRQKEQLAFSTNDGN